ncbi:MAG: four-carbon acid sugar kinase family protein [Verrucomicrobiales bacterium]|nr:four-carbon acid sugar kinase family protein [Verrucomicrobiales bacterium]
MIAILADDLSGAAELAGIAASRGFTAEVQTVFDPTSTADVIAVDTDTRLKNEAEAARIVGEVTRHILTANPAWLYKKTDSVLRGHVRAEIEAILDAAGLDDCVFIPANPSKDRLIQNGRYEIGGVPLDETVFARDPDYPRTSSLVRDLLGSCDRIRTPDAVDLNDLMIDLPPTTLTAGAADFFSAQLARKESSLGFSPSPPSALGLKPKPLSTLLLSGSLAAWDLDRASQMEQRGFLVKTISDDLSPSLWQTTSKLMLAIARPETGDPATLTKTLIDKALPLLSGRNDLRIGLEGGATAIALIRRLGWTRFEVIPEGHTGVGTLRPPGGPVICVKPGSYPWPETSL